MKKKFTAPKVTKIDTEEIMAGECGQLVTTSRGAKAAKIYYYAPQESSAGILIHHSRLKAINIPEGCTFVTLSQTGDWKENGIEYSVSPVLTNGWQQIDGDCYFVGLIYYKGQLIHKDNIGPYLAN